MKGFFHSLILTVSLRWDIYNIAHAVQAIHNRLQYHTSECTCSCIYASSNFASTSMLAKLALNYRREISVSTESISAFLSIRCTNLQEWYHDGIVSLCPFLSPSPSPSPPLINFAWWKQCSCSVRWNTPALHKKATWMTGGWVNFHLWCC